MGSVKLNGVSDKKSVSIPLGGGWPGCADAAESVLCALDCTYDQIVAALDSWEA